MQSRTEVNLATWVVALHGPRVGRCLAIWPQSRPLECRYYRPYFALRNTALCWKIAVRNYVADIEQKFWLQLREIAFEEGKIFSDADFRKELKQKVVRLWIVEPPVDFGKRKWVLTSRRVGGRVVAGLETYQKIKCFLGRRHTLHYNLFYAWGTKEITRRYFFQSR